MRFHDDCHDPRELHKEGRTSRGKISPQFAARLKQLGDDEKVRAVVLLITGSAGKSSGRRQSHDERQDAIEATRNAAKRALGDIDGILECFGGQRLAEQPDVLGSIPVEITAAGVNALAASEWVKLIVEDQSISLVI
jgi:hypothetical protein